MWLSDERMPGVVEIENSKFEVLGVAVSIGAVLDEFDLIIDTLQRAGRNRMVVPQRFPA